MASKTLEEVAEYMKKLHFRKGFFGIKPASLWKKLEDLDSEYRSVFYVQEISFEARLKEREEEIAVLKKKICALEALLPEDKKSTFEENSDEEKTGKGEEIFVEPKGETILQEQKGAGENG